MSLNVSVTEGASAPAPVESKVLSFVALSQFVVANGMEDEVKAAFRNRPHLVEDAPGFVRMEVLSPLDRPAEIWLITYWSDEANFVSWPCSHLNQESHQGRPIGLKLVSGQTIQRRFEFVCA